MKWFDGYRIGLVLVVFVAAIVLGGGLAKADFTFGEPTNLGPVVNTLLSDFGPNISTDGLKLYFQSTDRPGGLGGVDIWVTTRDTKDDEWGTPMNLGATVNTSAKDNCPSISADGLSLYFTSDRPGGSGERDTWVTRRAAKEEPWGEPVNLGPTVNSPHADVEPCILADELELYFHSTRPDGYGNKDIWVTTRAAKDDDWRPPVNLGPIINTSVHDGRPSISADELCCSSAPCSGLADTVVTIAG